MKLSVISRIAKIVPLAVVAAVGVTACSSGSPVVASKGVTAAPTTASASASAVAPSATPSAAAPSATPSAAPTTAAPAPSAPAATTPSAPAATAAPSAVAKPAPQKPSAQPAAAKPVKKEVQISFSGLTEGSRVEAGGRTVSFSVTWKNNTDQRYDKVVPVVASRFYDGAPCTMIARMAEGTLERKDVNGWTERSLSQGTGMDYAYSNDRVAFPLAPGASRTIEYRMTLGAANRPGRLPIEADAFLKTSDVEFKKLASTVVNTAVVDNRRPTVSVVSDPTGLVVGKDQSVFTVRATAPAGSGTIRPIIELPAVVDPKSPTTQYFLKPQDVRVEVKARGAWVPVTVGEDYNCNNRIAVDPESVMMHFPNGATEFTFRVEVKGTGGTGNKPTFLVGAEAGGHHSELVTLRPSVKR